MPDKLRSLVVAMIRQLSTGGFLLDGIGIYGTTAGLNLRHDGNLYRVTIEPVSYADNRLQLANERLLDPGADYVPHEWENDEPDKGLL